MKNFLLILFLLKFSFIFSQEIDSLKQLLITENSEQKIQTYISISDVFYYSVPDSAENYLKLALREAQKAENPKMQAKIMIKTGILYNEQGNIEKAKKLFSESLIIAEETGDTSLIISSKGNLGNCYLNLNKYNEAIKIYSEVIEIAEKNKNTIVEAIAYGALGNLYLIKNEYDKALKYYKTSEKKFKELNNTNGIALSLMNIATVYSNMGKNKEAVHKYKEADKLFKKNKNFLNSAKCISGIAKVYQKLNKFNKSIITEKEALKTYKNFDTKTDISYAYSMIASNYIKLKKYQTALLFLDSADNLSGTGKNFSKSEQISNKIRICYDSLGNYKKAYEYSELNKIYHDSIFNIENENKFAELEIQFETTKKEQEIELYKKNEELLQKESKNRLILLISVSSFLFLLIIILFLFYNRTKLKNRIKQSDLENKLLRVQMNPHFIFNALSSIEHYIYKNDIQNSSLYIADFAKLMRLILESSRKKLILLSQEIEILNYYVEFQKLRINYDLNFVINISDEIDPENCLLPPMLIQPFIENAFKHGFKGNIKNAELKVSLQLQNNIIFVEIKDNGIGIIKQKTGKTSHQSLSIQITKERLEKLFNKKTIKYNQLKIENLQKIDPNLHGTKISFKIPYIEEF